ncbi:MAG: hypothetical protein KGJ88_06200, partial [Verrucomicrobiota bacterium]|nr:hypothetical protein [Verrucomicrobiota bacterium]
MVARTFSRGRFAAEWERVGVFAARVIVARLEEEPHVNPNTGTVEFSLRDPDGYYVTISGRKRFFTTIRQNHSKPRKIDGGLGCSFPALPDPGMSKSRPVRAFGWK